MAVLVQRRTISQPADGSDFFVTLDIAQSTDGYGVTGQLVKGSKIPGIELPDVDPSDRTTTEFRVVTTAPLSSGDVLEFLVVS